MPTEFKGFCGPTYAYENKYAAVERCINLYPTVNESQTETKFRFCLDECPGTQAFGPIPAAPPLNQAIRGLLACGSFGLFGVSGDQLWHMTSAGVYDFHVALTNSVGFTNPVSMVQTGTNQLFIADNGRAYVLQLDTLVLTNVANTDYIAGGYCTFQDGYILAISQPVYVGLSPNFIQISGNSATPVGDARIWDPANISKQAGQADPLQAIISSREYVRILGAARSQIYYNAGANGLGGFPFQSYNETFIETGIAAPWSLSDLGDSLVWIGQDKRGIRAAWQDFGFQPQRISTFAIEQFWQQYGDISDAIAFSYIWKGHLFWQITFIAANATWVYDATVSKLVGRPIWHERTYTTPGTGLPRRRQELFHAYCYGLHLVGSNANPLGTILQYADSYSDVFYDGVLGRSPIVPDRICPHIFSSLNRVIVNRLRVDMQVGVGNGANPNPMLNMQISRDAGNTFGQTYSVSIGHAAEFTKQVYFNRLGYARDLVIRVFGDGINRVPYNFVGAYLDAQECLS